MAESVLVQQALKGDQGAFEALVNRYKKPLFGLIYHYIGEYHEAEDILTTSLAPTLPFFSEPSPIGADQALAPHGCA